MAGFAIAVYALLLTVAVAVVWLLVRLRAPRASVPPSLVPVIAAARRRAFIAVLCAVFVFIAGVVLGLSVPELLGAPIAVASLLAGSCGLLLYAATPPRTVDVSPQQTRAAALTRRSALSVAPRRALLAAAEVAAIFVGLLVVFGLLSTTDSEGRSRAIAFHTADSSSMSSPFPGWFYGVPALLGLGVLVAATVVALHRIGSTAAFPAATDADLDLAWRRNSAEVVLKLAVGAALFTLGGFSVLAGTTMHTAIIADGTPVVWSVLAGALTLFGVLFLVLSVVSVTLAALTALTIADRVRPARPAALPRRARRAGRPA